jgi:predicted nucleotidyltransferase
MSIPIPRLPVSFLETILGHLADTHPLLIYVFGSFGTTRQHPSSDLDLAILAAVPLPPMRCFELASELSERMGCPVDLINLQQASTVMAKEVIRTGTLIHGEHHPARDLFEMQTLSDYARLNEERSAVIATVL